MSTTFKKNASLRLVLLIALVISIYLILVWLLVYVEKDSGQTALNTYSNAIWYSLVTLTTVGYGDIFPATVWGRYISLIFILTSIGIFGILIGQLTTLMTTIKENKKLGYTGTGFTNHAVIIGWNEFGWHVVDQLVGVGRRVAVVTNKKDDVDLIREKYSSKNVFVLFSDYNNHDLIKKSNIEEATIVFVNMEDDTDKLVYVLNLKKVFPETEFVVTLENGDLKNTFLAAGVSNTISTQEISSKLLASYMFEPDVATYSESILSYAKSDTDYDIKQLLITPNNPYNGKSYQDVFFDLKKRYNSVLIGITKRDKFGQKKLIKNPLGDLKIHTGDYLIIILNGKAFKLLKRIFAVEEGAVKE
ncbi:voltage-gated potassium channel [Ekhidna lutea]|uniref:Voltage-gated potassium channel n=1 Tax=Ekhidna lutea TaxID=447679 RepID=A0A239LKV3_EKHLU|nr:potassium channel protein [Ekhidna lutea]SNT31015.1 voltage-gated potassium channel [Ekhidna lutea]